MLLMKDYNFIPCAVFLIILIKPDHDFSQQNNSVFFGLFFQKTIHCAIEVVASEAAAAIWRRGHTADCGGGAAASEAENWWRRPLVPNRKP